MSGNRTGGIKAMQTNKQRYGDGSNGKPSFPQVIGRLGGLLSRGGGFSSNPELARAAGAKGGKAPRRKKRVDA